MTNVDSKTGPKTKYKSAPKPKEEKPTSPAVQALNKTNSCQPAQANTILLNGFRKEVIAAWEIEDDRQHQSQASMREAPASGPSLSAQRRSLRNQLHYHGALAGSGDSNDCGHKGKQQPCYRCGRLICTPCSTTLVTCRDQGRCHRNQGARGKRFVAKPYAEICFYL